MMKIPDGFMWRVQRIGLTMVLTSNKELDFFINIDEWKQNGVDIKQRTGFFISTSTNGNSLTNAAFIGVVVADLRCDLN
ncbi:hypothetical protein HanXRQr2_Chr09g0384671 [Helianthus annuus]|uniref:Uncharacterized protein n=1 Tax=Helianthus annuus TaxID=4232 RepID=A0A9K3I516_HELAN|nr:hypothetical protein HanXRQr2_Chr09g0384671 [Helianthus annuus]